MLTSILDSYYAYVTKRLVTLQAQVSINGSVAAQPMGGLVAAQDWPQTPVTEGAIYLVLQRMMPRGKSKTQRQYLFMCQWTWLLIGTDIPEYSQAENRADRWRSNLQIAQNLKEANYPGFCQKMDYMLLAPDAWKGTATPAQSTFPVSATERIRWDDLEFMPRPDNSSGVLYYAAGVTVMGWEDMQCAADLTYADTNGPQIA